MSIKIKKLFFAVISISVLLFSSCNNISQDDDDTPQNNDIVSNFDGPTIKLSVSFGDARTALPVIDTSKIETFTLKGKLNSAEDFETLGTWTTDSSKTAFEKMTAVELPIAVGTWTFELTASVKDTRSSIPLAVYSGYLVQVIAEATDETNHANGKYNLDFILSLDSLTTSGTGATAGALEITVNFGEDTASEIKYLEVNLYTSNGSTPANDSSGDPAIATSTITSETTSFVYMKTLAPGVYIADFTFYASTDTSVPIAKWREAININQLGATSSKTINLNNLDKVYNITYVERCDFNNNNIVAISNNGAGNLTKYSRRSNFTLASPTKSNYTFWRWVEGGSYLDGQTTKYTSSDSDSSVVTTVNGFVGNKVYVAEFISENAKPRIGSVKIYDDDDTNNATGESQIKVGHTITAKAFDTDGNAFKGNVTWKWYVTVDNITSQIASSSINSTTSETDGQVSSYLVPAEYANATITAIALQEYIVDDSITNVFRNKVAFDNLEIADSALLNATNVSFIDETSTASSVYSSFNYSGTKPVLVKTSETIGKGDLDTSEIRLKYGSDGNLFTVIGENLDGAADPNKTNFYNFYVASGTLKDKKQTSWTIPSGDTDSPDSRRVKIQVKNIKLDSENTTSAIAPATSGEYTVIADISVVDSNGADLNQYNVAQDVEIPNVHLHVQAAAPSSETITFRDPCMVTYGNFRFKNTNPSETATANLQYSLNGTTWYDWNVTSSSLGDSYSAETACEIAAGTSTSVYVRTVGTEFENSSNGTAITNVEANGYIKPSAPVTIILKDDDSENPVNHIGTLVRLTGIAFNYQTYASENTAGNPEVGTRISLTPASAVTDQSVTGTYNYTWSVKDSNGVVVTGGTGAGSTFDLDNGSYAGNTLYATVVVTYPTATGDTAEDSLAQRTFTINKPIAKGNMNLSEIYAVSEEETPTITTQKIAYYNTTENDTKLIPGSTPDSSKLHIINGAVVKNELGTLSGVTYTFPEGTIVKTDADSTKTLPVSVAGSASVGTTPVTVSAVGYNSKTIYVAIPIDTNIAKTLLSDNISTIPYGHILFKTANDGATLEYRVLKTGATDPDLTSDDSYYADWAPVTSEPLNKAGSYSTSSVLSSNYLFADTDVVYVRYVGTETELALSLTDSDTSKTYVGTRSASVTVSISESAEYISVSGTNVVAPSTWTSCVWTVDDVVIDNSTDNSTTMLSITTAVSGKYHVLIEAVDSYGNPVSDEAWVTVTIR